MIGWTGRGRLAQVVAQGVHERRRVGGRSPPRAGARRRSCRGVAECPPGGGVVPFGDRGSVRTEGGAAVAVQGCAHEVHEPGAGQELSASGLQVRSWWASTAASSVASRRIRMRRSTRGTSSPLWVQRGALTRCAGRAARPAPAARVGGWCGGSRRGWRGKAGGGPRGLEPRVGPCRRAGSGCGSRPGR